MNGKVHLVGAGPGDPELLTLRAAKLIERADVVVYDRLVHPGALAMVKAGCRLIFVGKEGGGEQVTQLQINKILIEQSRLGREVVRLKGGDPFVFGRGGEEALALHDAGIEFDVVPGISSGIAGPALANIPVTHRGISTSVTFATGHTASGEPEFEFLSRAQTLVLFMSGQRLEETARALIANGRAAQTPCAIIEAASWQDQRVVEAPLDEISARAREAQVGSPALLVIGEVVKLRSQLASIAQAALAAGGEA